MPASADTRLTHITRIFGQEAGASATAARLAIAANPADFANALRAEAAASDDVTSAETALGYLDDRLAWFGDFIAPKTGAEIRAAFAKAIEEWA